MEDFKPESIISFRYSFFLEEIDMIIWKNHRNSLPVHRERENHLDVYRIEGIVDID